MIIWLASYPKSGNTWVRMLIGQILSEDRNKDSFFEDLKKIYNYPERVHFKKLVNDFSNRDEIIKNWINSQNIINLKNENIILKTHNILGSFGKYSFTNYKVTEGVIYIVRDPRNIISSLKNHFFLKDINEAKEFIFEKNQWLFEKNRVDTFISSWNYHYKSWKTFKKNYLLIKYEDLLQNPRDQVLRIYQYLKKFFKINSQKINIDQIIENSSFSNLQKIENEGKFNENKVNQVTGEKAKFFHLGPLNNWRTMLDDKTVSDVEKNFRNEMKELGYL